MEMLLVYVILIEPFRFERNSDFLVEFPTTAELLLHADRLLRFLRGFGDFLDNFFRR